MQGLLSSQLRGSPPTQAPPKHVSCVVQGLPSSHSSVLLVLTHPEAESQASVVQGFESSQSGAGPPTQVPPAQVSLVVQALASSHSSVLLALTHPEVGAQLSVVQGFESSQSGAGPPIHSPAAQVSFVVQALASSQSRVLLALTHPEVGSQLSVVQGFASSQSGAGPPAQAPATQVSLVVQALASSQTSELGV